MANSIALNSDMDKLIYTTSSGSTEISLSGNGALVDVSGGQITATAAAASFPGTPVTKSTSDGQWTLIYNPGTNIAWIIGIDDIDTSKTIEGNEFTMEKKKYNIRRSGTNLEIYTD